MATSASIFLTGAFIALRAAQPSSEKWYGPLAAGFGLGAAVLGIVLLLGDTRRAKQIALNSTDDSQARFQAKVGFPAAVGIFSAAAQYQKFVAQRLSLKETRQVIDTVLLEKAVERERKEVELLQSHQSLQREAQLVEAIDRAKAAVSEAEKEWARAESSENSLLEHLVSIRDNARAEIEMASKAFEDAGERLTEQQR